MSAPSTGQALTLGAVLSETARLCAARFALFFVIALGPGALSEAAFRGLLQNFYSEMTGAIAAFLVGATAYAVASAAIGGVLAADWRGTGAPAFAALRQGLSAAAPAVAVSLITAALLIAGFAALVIPGLIVAVYFFVAIPAAVLEPGGPARAMSRSIELCKGSRWRVFGLVLLTSLLAAPFVVWEVAIHGSLTGGPFSSEGWPNPYSPFWSLPNLAGLALEAVHDMFTIALSFVVYLRLVELKEGPERARVASVFE